MKKLILLLLVSTGLLIEVLCPRWSTPTKTQDADIVQELNGVYILPITSTGLWEPVCLDPLPPVEEEPSASEEDIELLALLTMAEAEGESVEGQRLVIDTVLNRVDDPHFPNSIQEVIWQKNQFSSMWDGRIAACHVKEELVKLVQEELENRTNYDVIFFRTNRYHTYGVPMFQVGAHYFSSYD